MIECKICGKEFVRITPTHLKTHNLSTKEYKSRFGNDSILSEENRLNMSRTRESMIKKYGENEGEKRWNSYCIKQADSNTFEYKHDRYGWTMEDFDLYNKSRAVTKENMITKWGMEIGNRRWVEYCEHQAYAGCARDYFIEKYGKAEGKKRYNKVCYDKGSAFRGKSLSTEHKMNCRIGALKYLENIHGQLSPRYNPKACEAIDKLSIEMGVNFQHAENGGEVRLDIGYWVDGYCEDENIVVEYYEPWHKNQIEKDKDRIQEIKDFLGCQVIIIREEKDGSQTIENF